MNWEVIKVALNILWQGMLAIFVVIGLIVITVKLTAYCIAKAEDAKKAKESQNSQADNQ